MRPRKNDDASTVFELLLKNGVISSLVTPYADLLTLEHFAPAQTRSSRVCLI